jgi:hypothetical protein
MPQRLRATVAPPNCILCDGLASPPSRRGWLQAPDRQAVFWVCGRCSDCSDAELEAKIVALVSGASAGAVGEADGSQGAYWPATNGGGGCGPAHLGGAGGSRLGKASDGSTTAGGVTPRPTKSSRTERIRAAPNSASFRRLATARLTSVAPRLNRNDYGKLLLAILKISDDRKKVLLLEYGKLNC